MPALEPASPPAIVNPAARPAGEHRMSKNKGGREARKPKQVKTPKTTDGAQQPLKVESSTKPRRTK